MTPLGEARLGALADLVGSGQFTFLALGVCLGLRQQSGQRGLVQLRIGLAPVGQFPLQRGNFLNQLLDALGFVTRLLGKPRLFALGSVATFDGLVAVLACRRLAPLQRLLPGLR